MNYWMNPAPFKGPDVCLVQSAKQLEEACAAQGIYPQHKEFPLWETAVNSSGVTWSFEVDDQPIWIVGLPPTTKEPLEVVATLVHEAVHVWQGWSAFLGESEPSDEFEAYSIEAISSALIKAYTGTLKAPKRSRQR